MSYVDIILLAIALSVDACVVSFSYGLCLEMRHKRSAFALASTTGFFQGFMPFISYAVLNCAKNSFIPDISSCSFTKWIVFVIFMYLGLTFIYEARNKTDIPKLCLTFKALILVGIATSIDALSAGVSLFLTSSPMKFSIITIGLVTFINSLLGYYFGNRLKLLKSNYLEIIGGLILVGLAIKNILS